MSWFTPVEPDTRPSWPKATTSGSSPSTHRRVAEAHDRPTRVPASASLVAVGPLPSGSVIAAKPTAKRGRPRAPPRRSGSAAPGPPVGRASTKRSLPGVSLAPITHIARRSRSSGGRWPFPGPSHRSAPVSDPAGSWGSPHHLAGRSFRFACAPPPERTVSARPPTAVVSGLLRGSSVGRSLWLLLGLDPLRSAAVKATVGPPPKRPSIGDSRDPQAYPPTFFVVPRSPRVVHQLATGPCTGRRWWRLSAMTAYDHLLVRARRRARRACSPSRSTAPRS